MNRTIIVPGIVLALACAIVSGDEAEQPAGEKRNRAKELAGTVVITNEVLSRLYGPAPAQTGPPAAAEEPSAILLPDPLEAMDVAAGQRRNRRDLIIVTRKRIAALEARLQELQARKLAAANPFLPRPVLTREEEEAWEGLDGAARVQQTEAAIQAVRSELDAAREELARFSRGT
jgi:hypothetical protein